MIERIFHHMKTAAPVSLHITDEFSKDSESETHQELQMTQIPWLDKYLYKNWLVDTFRKTPGLAILKFVNQVIAERQKSGIEEKQAKTAPSAEKDLLARYLEIQTKSPGTPPWYVGAWP